MNNGAVRCGSTVCNQVSKTFTENPLPIGYFHIATIPAGASNISILELKNSENYLGMWEKVQEIVHSVNKIIIGKIKWGDKIARILLLLAGDVQSIDRRYFDCGKTS